MEDTDVGFLPVGEDDRLVGMVTDRDIALRAVAKKEKTRTQRGCARRDDHEGSLLLRQRRRTSLLQTAWRNFACGVCRSSTQTNALSAWFPSATSRVPAQSDHGRQNAGRRLHAWRNAVPQANVNISRGGCVGSLGFVGPMPPERAAAGRFAEALPPRRPPLCEGAWIFFCRYGRDRFSCRHVSLC